MLSVQTNQGRSFTQGICLFKDSLNVIKLVKFEDQQSSATRDKAKGLNKNNKSVLTRDSGDCVVHFAMN